MLRVPLFFLFFWHLHRCAGGKRLWHAYAEGMTHEDAGAWRATAIAEIRLLIDEMRWLWRYPSFLEIRLFLFVLSESWHAILVAVFLPLVRNRQAWYFLSLVVPWFVIERHAWRFAQKTRDHAR